MKYNESRRKKEAEKRQLKHRKEVNNEEGIPPLIQTLFKLPDMGFPGTGRETEESTQLGL